MIFLIFIFLPIISSQINNTNFTTNTLNSINLIQNTLINSNKENQMQSHDSIKVNEIINSSNYYSDNILNKKVNTNMKKNLLIGTFKKYKWKVVAPFFESYNKSNFTNCDCVMFVDRVSKNTLNKLKSLGVIVLPIPNKYNRYRIISYRWKLYEEYINNNIDKYNLIFTTDIRDTFFQQDVFKFYDSSKSFLGFSIEEGDLREETNKGWIIDAFGEDIYKTMENERIICGGAVWGTPDKFIELSQLLWSVLKTERSIKVDIIDQSVVNYYIHHEKKFNDCLIKSYNNNGTVMTIGIGENYKLDNEDNILNYKGEIASVIHQYDRHPDIVKKVMNKFCPEIVIQLEKENKIKKYIKCFGVCILILEIFFFLKNLTKKKSKREDNKCNKTPKLSNESLQKEEEFNNSTLSIINSQIN